LNGEKQRDEMVATMVSPQSQLMELLDAVVPMIIDLQM